MQTRNLITALALGIVFTAGCATQDTKTTSGVSRDTAVSAAAEDFSTLDATDVSIEIRVKCIGSNCFPYPNVYIAVTNPKQRIVFDLVTPNRVFDNMGIEFADKSYVCTRTPGSDLQYTCAPNNPTLGVLLKYTIRVVGAIPHDPYAFVKN